MLDYLKWRWRKKNAGCKNEKPHRAGKIGRPSIHTAVIRRV